MKTLKTRYLSLLAAFFLTTGLFAQIDIAWGKEFPMPKIFSSISLEGYNKNVVIAEYVAGIANDRSFYRFDKNTLNFQGNFDPIQKGGEIKGKDYYSSISLKN